MALKPVYTGLQPLGIFDGYDNQVTSLVGGEVCTFSYVAVASDQSAWENSGADGYTDDSGTNVRTVVTNTLGATTKQFYLADEGVKHYGTLIGSVIGGRVGKVAGANGTAVGPHTAEGSGKVTLWGQGIYMISSDALASGFDMTTLKPGAPLYVSAAGKLMSTSSGAGAGGTVVARFIEYTNGNSYVSTSKLLAKGGRSWNWVMIDFNPEV